MRDTWGMTTVLTPTERTALVADHPGWAIVGDTVERTFTFADFGAAMGFVVQVALAAEQADHHPDVDIRWNRVTLRLSTHSAGTLTTRDRDLVARIGGWGSQA